MIRINYERCDLCGTCVGVCPFDALELTEMRLSVITERCTECNFCVEICPVRALLNDRPENNKPSMHPNPNRHA